MEARSAITLDGGVVLTRCDQCRQMYAERNPPSVPDCDKLCPDRMLVEENEDAVMIFSLTQGQLIMGPSGPIDINHLAVYAAMDLYEIKDRRECFQKVLRLARWHINKIRGRDDES